MDEAQVQVGNAELLQAQSDGLPRCRNAPPVSAFKETAPPTSSSLPFRFSG